MTIKLPKELTLEERREFWRNYDKWVEWFGAELVDAELLELRVEDIVSLHPVVLKGSRDPKYPGGKYLGTDWQTVELCHPLDSSYTKWS